MAELLDGKKLALEIQAELKEQVAHFREETALVPTLAAVLVGEDPASQVYVRNKERACERVGMKSRLTRLPAAATETQLLQLIDQLNRDQSINGILVQLPLPSEIDEQRILDAVSPLKDVDAFHPENVGLISQGRPRFLPCTPHGILQILARNQITTIGRHVVIVGRSNIVGRPLALMLSQADSTCGPETCNATVTLCHSKTSDLAKITRQADILVAAVGRAHFITSEMVAPGTVVIDVGINRDETGLVGDVDFRAVSKIASHITPVPGGIGPMTVTMLLHNTLIAARLQKANQTH
jgi:methylenetetrahydrofolate dehydrogenase (NADP+)/methenyltetrahydrofolate cyclohydrolase